jgi:CopG family nickel-responsive transcriptional regulator
MGKLVRFGVSMADDLLAAFDALIAAKGYANRSEAVRDLVRQALVDRAWESGRGAAVGALCLVYDHHARDLAHRLTHLQHEHVSEIVSTLHVHLDTEHCLEVLVLRGKAKAIHAIADRLIAMKGVQHGRLLMTAAGGGLRQ